MKTRVPDHILAKIKEVRRVATMESAGFGFDTEKVSCNGWEPVENMTKDAFIKSETRLWRETWIIPQLDEVIKWMEGGKV